MYLGNPSLPISIKPGKARQIIEKALKERNWKDFSIDGERLLLVPYYFFEYSTYSEEEKEGERVVSGVERGELVLNPETSEIMEGVAEQLPAEREMLHEIPEQEFELEKPKLKESDAEKICHLKTAEKLGKPLEKVSVMNVRLFYVPLWEVQARIGEQELVLHVSAVDGTILEERSLPTREKTAAEITKETLEELKDPKAWVRYTSELIQLAAKSSRGKGRGNGTKMKIKPVWVITVVLILILLAVVFLL